MSFCNNCGNQIDGERFCPHCGAEVEPVGMEAPVSAATTMTTTTKNRSVLTIGIIGVVVLALVIGAIFLFTGRSSKSVALDCVKAMYNADAKKIVSLLPKDAVSYTVKERYDGDKEKFIREGKESLESKISSLEKQGIDPKKDIKYEFKYEDDLTEDELEKLNDQSDVKEAGIKIKKAKRVEIKVTMKVDGKEKISTPEIITGKVGGKWCVIDF